jgi:hypothetical protein
MIYTYVEYCRLIRDVEGWNEINALAVCLEEEKMSPVLKLMLINKLWQKIAQGI